MKHLLIAAALAGALAAPAARAEYPEKPIEMIVAFAAGGGTDVAARSIAGFMEKYLDGGRIAVINKPGAGGEIGWTTLAEARPDGYTIGFINAPAINALAVEGKAKYRMDDFQPIANLVYDPGVLVVNTDSPYKSLEDVVAAAKTDEGAVVIGHLGGKRLVRAHRAPQSDAPCQDQGDPGLLRGHRTGAPGGARWPCAGCDHEPVGGAPARSRGADPDPWHHERGALAVPSRRPDLPRAGL